MNYLCEANRTGPSKYVVRLRRVPIFVTLAALLSFMVYGGTSEMSEKQSAEQPEVSAELLAALAKWQVVRVPSRHHELLRKLVGEWDVTLRFHAGEQTWESACRSQCTLLHRGRFMLEQITGQVYAPDEKGSMRLEPFTATRILGHDNYKKTFVGIFIDNQNTALLTFLGIQKPGPSSEEIVMFGLIDEPMLDIHDTTMKYLLHLKDKDHYAWERYALAVSDDAKVIDFNYSRTNTKR